MSTQEPGRTPPALTSLPRIEDLPRAGEGYDPARVEEAFETFRRHSAQLQAQLRVLQAAGRSPHTVEPTGHAVRMDALHLIRAASEFADTLERDAQSASQTQLAKTEEEVRRRRREVQERESEVERYRAESERQRAETLNNARNESRELLANTSRQATQELQEAEARGNRLLEQARHQATELTNAARAEVEQTLEWARAQASAILARAQTGAEQLLAAAGLSEDDIGRVANAIVEEARDATESRRAPARPIAVPPSLATIEDEPESPAEDTAESPADPTEPNSPDSAAQEPAEDAGPAQEHAPGDDQQP